MRKGEIACNKQFLFFSRCFLPFTVHIFHFTYTLKCGLQIVTIWTSLKFCRLAMGFTRLPFLTINHMILAMATPLATALNTTLNQIMMSKNEIQRPHQKAVCKNSLYMKQTIKMTPIEYFESCFQFEWALTIQRMVNRCKL